jgi:hypothetical protein
VVELESASPVEVSSALPVVVAPSVLVDVPSLLVEVVDVAESPVPPVEPVSVLVPVSEGPLISGSSSGEKHAPEKSAVMIPARPTHVMETGSPKVMDDTTAECLVPLGYARVCEPARYATNSFRFGDLFTDEGQTDLYYPRFVALRFADRPGAP